MTVLLQARPRMVSFMSPAAPRSMAGAFSGRGKTPLQPAPSTPSVSRSAFAGLQCARLCIGHATRVLLAALQAGAVRSGMAILDWQGLVESSSVAYQRCQGPWCIYSFAAQVAIKPLNSSEFAAACSTLADMGLLGLGKAREERQRRVTLRAHKDDVALALQDIRLLRNVLSLA